MALQDDLTLRDEINQIAERIDSILHAINRVYPMESEASPENQRETGPKEC